jgi:hypothetical protein
MTNMRRNWTLRNISWVLVATVLVPAACASPTDAPGNGNPPPVETPPPDTTSHTPPPGSPPLARIVVMHFGGPRQAGDTLRLGVSTLADDGRHVPAELVWSSSDPELATVAADGLVTLHAGGTVQIRAAVGAIEGVAFIYIMERAPVLLSLTPDRAVAGDGPLTVTVRGQYFGRDATVLWMAQPRPTTRISATELRVEIPASDLRTPGFGPFSVMVRNGGPFGLVSNRIFFTVEWPPVVETFYNLAGLEDGTPLPVEVRRGTWTSPAGRTHNAVTRVVEGGMSIEERAGRETLFTQYVREEIVDVDSGAILWSGTAEWFGAVEYDMFDGSLIFVWHHLPGVMKTRANHPNGFTLMQYLGDAVQPWRYVRR